MRQLQIFFVIELDVLKVGITKLEVPIEVARWCDYRVSWEVLFDPVNLCHNLLTTTTTSTTTTVQYSAA